MDDSDPCAWAKLLFIPYGGLSVSRKEEDGPSLTAKIRSAVNSYRECTHLSPLLEPTCLTPPAVPTHGVGAAAHSDARKRLVARNLAKMDVRGAIMVLSSTEEFAEDDVHTNLSKHPPSPDDLTLPDASPAPNHFYSEGELMAALRSFPVSSSAGHDGLRPAHLLDLVGPRSRRRTPTSADEARQRGARR